MKSRQSFVSNSSSASFILPKKNLPQSVIDAVKNYYQYARDHGLKTDLEPEERPYDRWEILEYDDRLEGRSDMDNFGMSEFFRKLFEEYGIPTWRYERDY